jgi:subtilisin family serine protease
MRKILLIALLCGLPLLACCQKYFMRMNGGNFNPEPGINTHISEEELVNGRYYRYIQFFQIPSEAQKQKLAQRGIKLLNYIPDNIFSVSIASDAELRQLSDPNIRSLFSINPSYKLSDLLTAKKLPEQSLRGAGQIELTVSCYPDLSPDEGVALLKTAGLTVLHSLVDAGAYRVLASVDDIKQIAALPYVTFIEPIDTAPVPDNLTGVTNHRSNTIATEYSGGLKYDGRGVTVAMNDDGTIGAHIDFQGRIFRQNITFDNGLHGDLCAGVIFGAGNIDPTTRGMAFGAKLDVYGVTGYSPLVYQAFDSIYAIYDRLGVRITSTSYSDGLNEGYTALARTMDVQINAMPQLMHVFSAGNFGAFNSVSGGHKQAKNVITVGNVTSQDELGLGSSCGPARDGRIKPDVCAVGSDVRSTAYSNTYQTHTGTSLSCPGVAGVLAQLYQAYKSMHGGENPPSALIKAAVLNTADDIGNPGPDFRFGYGRINARRAFSILKNNQYQTGVITQGALQTHTIAVPANVAEVKIMVYWHDKEGTAGAAKALVNNLDMTVTTPAATTVLPWVLNAASANTNAIRGIDALNNMEQVTIQTPVAGNYTVNISGFSVPQGPQHYYMVYELVMNDIVVTYPMGGESIVPGIPEMIRWDTYEKTGIFTVQYSTDNGASWVNISTTTPGSVRSLSWTPPATVTGQALVRVTRGMQSGQSDATFSIIGVPKELVVDWVCIDSMQVSYNAVPNATGYIVSVLGNEYMIQPPIPPLRAVL